MSVSAAEGTMTLLLRAAEGLPHGAWKVDDWLKDVLLAFTSAEAPAIRAALAPALPCEWTAANVATAPAPVRAIVERTGDLRAGQLVLTSAPADPLIAYALWWPWGGGGTISLRLGLAGAATPKDRAALEHQLGLGG